MSMFTNLKGIFKFELLQMPGLSCILKSYSAFDQTLHLYTIAPLLILVALFLPVPVARARGFHNASNGLRWRQVLDKYWTNTVSHSPVAVRVHVFSCSGYIDACVFRTYVHS